MLNRSAFFRKNHQLDFTFLTILWPHIARYCDTIAQRKRDDNKNKICTFQGGLGRGAGRKIVQNAIFHGKRHDNKILKVKILLSRNFVVMAQAPNRCDTPCRANYFSGRLALPHSGAMTPLGT